MKKHNTKPSRRQSGFSLVELTITMALFSILAGVLQYSMIHRQIKQVNQEQSELAAGEIYRLANAAQLYAMETGMWPNEAGRCRTALSVLQHAGRLKGITKDSPFQADNGDRSPWKFDCTSRHFTISVDTHNPRQAGIMAVNMPGATYSNTLLYANYPKSAGGNGNAMPLDGSAQPTDSWNMGDQYLFDARDVATTTGQTLVNSVQYATAAKPGDLIRKPTCPAGMQPRILTALNHVALTSGRALHAIQLPVDELTNAWRVRAVLTGSSGNESVGDRNATIAAFVKCSY